MPCPKRQEIINGLRHVRAEKLYVMFVKCGVIHRELRYFCRQTYLDMDHMGAANKFSRPTPNAMTSKIKQALGFMRNQRQEVCGL